LRCLSAGALGIMRERSRASVNRRDTGETARARACGPARRRCGRCARTPGGGTRASPRPKLVVRAEPVQCQTCVSVGRGCDLRSRYPRGGLREARLPASTRRFRPVIRRRRRVRGPQARPSSVLQSSGAESGLGLNCLRDFKSSGRSTGRPAPVAVRQSRCAVTLGCRCGRAFSRRFGRFSWSYPLVNPPQRGYLARTSQTERSPA
jgi:hypothetical protein